MKELLCIIAIIAYPFLTFAFFYFTLKNKNHETQKKRKSAQKVLHSKPRRNSTLKQTEMFKDVSDNT